VEALNTDFRYQLTVIGDFAQAVVAKKLADGRFTIRTDRPGVEVSWQVTGVRKEAYPGSRVAVESLKPEELRGLYVDAAAYGQPEEKRIGWSAGDVNSA
jgi:trimeric autotransporter adhesin